MCCLEFPDLEKLSQKYKDRGLLVFGMNASVGQDPPSVLLAFAKQTGIHFPILLHTDALFRTYGRQQKMPLEVILDRRGKIAYMAHRFDADAIEKTIARLLPKK